MKKTILGLSNVAALAILFTGLTSYADHSAPEGAMQSTVVSAVTHEVCHIETNLTLGSRSDEVSCLQEHLIEDGLLVGITEPTGFFGEVTKSAVIKWQEEKGLPTTGFFGALSREAFSHHEEASTLVEVHVAHPPIDVSTWPQKPSVSIKVHPDAMAGWNLEIITENFRFAPEHASGAVVPNEGHAHLMVGGKKLARVYGSWFHIPKEAAVGIGQHEVLVTLNANNHSDLAVNGQRVEAKQTITIQ